jgi:hypothetical protein
MWSPCERTAARKAPKVEGEWTDQEEALFESAAVQEILVNGKGHQRTSPTDYNFADIAVLIRTRTPMQIKSYFRDHYE